MTPDMKNPAAARGGTGLHQTVQLGGFEQSEGSPSIALVQARRRMIQKAHLEALSLGTRLGNSAEALAIHHARQLRALLSGGAQ